VGIARWASFVGLIPVTSKTSIFNEIAGNQAGLRRCCPRFSIRILRDETRMPVKSKNRSQVSRRRSEVKIELGSSVSWLWLLGFQVFSAAVAAVVFQLGLDPRIAGLIAGSTFVAVGIRGARTSWIARAEGLFPNIVFLMSLVHVLGIALPMLGFRLLNWSQPFSKVAVWGLSGPQFHEISTRVFGFWVIFTAVAAYKARKL
jgi:hypothetical protein